ncbi:MAG: phage tail protein [Gemmatimonadales bacterium]
MAPRTTPYGAFNFIVAVEDADFGGFSDVSGLSTELTAAEYREGTDRENHVRKIPGVHKVGDVTLKRGIVNSSALWQWITDVRLTGVAAKKKSVVVTLQDEAHQDVQRWILSSVMPLKYTGPTLAGKGGGDVAMEEIVLSAEGIEIAKA